MAVELRYTGRGVYLNRLNRFVVLIDVDGAKIKCHLHDTGRVDHVLVPGESVVLFKRVARPGRLTDCDVVAGITPSGEPVILDSRVPNAIFKHYYSEVLEEPEGEMVSEPQVQGARIDFMVVGGSGVWAIEVKGVNLSEAGVGLFPNAPSQRAHRHLEVLARLSLEGYRPAMVFVALRSDIEAFAPNRRVDPRFSSLSCALKPRISYIGVRVSVNVEPGRVLAEYAGRAPYLC
jgi:sugar fermentation stimulation protein A